MATDAKALLFTIFALVALIVGFYSLLPEQKSRYEGLSPSERYYQIILDDPRSAESEKIYVRRLQSYYRALPPERQRIMDDVYANPGHVSEREQYERNQAAIQRLDDYCRDKPWKC